MCKYIEIAGNKVSSKYLRCNNFPSIKIHFREF